MTPRLALAQHAPRAGQEPDRDGYPVRGDREVAEQVDPVETGQPIEASACTRAESIAAVEPGSSATARPEEQAADDVTRVVHAEEPGTRHRTGEGGERASWPAASRLVGRGLGEREQHRRVAARPRRPFGRAMSWRMPWESA